jgi:hypothetical protein
LLQPGVVIRNRHGPELRRRQVNDTQLVVGVRRQRIPRNGEPLSSNSQKTSKRQHGTSHSTGTRVEYDFLNFTYKLACRIVDIVAEKTRCADEAIVHRNADSSGKSWLTSDPVEHVMFPIVVFRALGRQYCHACLRPIHTGHLPNKRHAAMASA